MSAQLLPVHASRSLVEMPNPMAVRCSNRANSNSTNRDQFIWCCFALRDQKTSSYVTERFDDPQVHDCDRGVLCPRRWRREMTRFKSGSVKFLDKINAGTVRRLSMFFNYSSENAKDIHAVDGSKSLFLIPFRIQSVY